MSGPLDTPSESMHDVSHVIGWADKVLDLGPRTPVFPAIVHVKDDDGNLHELNLLALTAAGVFDAIPDEFKKP